VAKHLLIVAHVPSPNTLRLRDAVLAGATLPEITEVEVRALTPFEAVADHVLWSDAVVLGTTENLGYMSARSRTSSIAPTTRAWSAPRASLMRSISAAATTARERGAAWRRS